MKQSDAIKVLSKISVSQWGLFTSAQAQTSGVSRLNLSRLCEREFIERLGFGIYKMSSTPSSRLTDIQVAWLSLEPKKFAHERRAQREEDFVVGGHTATYLYEVGDLYPDPYLFLSPKRKQSQRSELSFRMSALSKDDVRLIDGLPVTSPERTIATLASEGEDLSHIEGAMLGFAKHYTLDESTLGTLLSPHSKKYGFVDGTSFSAHLYMQVFLNRAQDFKQTFMKNPAFAEIVNKDFRPMIQSAISLHDSREAMTKGITLAFQDLAKKTLEPTRIELMQAMQERTKELASLQDSLREMDFSHLANIHSRNKKEHK